MNLWIKSLESHIVDGQAAAGLDVRIAQELIDRARELSSEGQLKLVGHRSLVEV